MSRLNPYELRPNPIKWTNLTSCEMRRKWSDSYMMLLIEEEIDKQKGSYPILPHIWQMSWNNLTLNF